MLVDRGSGCELEKSAHNFTMQFLFRAQKPFRWLNQLRLADAKSEIEEINGNDNETRTRYFIQEINCTGAGKMCEESKRLFCAARVLFTNGLASPHHCRLQLIILNAPAKDFRTKAKLIECGLKF